MNNNKQSNNKLGVYKMSNLKTILGELVSDHIDLRGMDKESKEAWEEDLNIAVAKIEGMIPEKKDEAKHVINGKAVGKNDRAIGYNRAIEDMKANLGGEK